MKLSSVNEKKKKNQPADIDNANTRSILKVLEEAGLSEEVLVATAMELYVPHPGVENMDIAQQVFKRELKLALSDPNLCILLYAGMLLEREGEKGELPGISKEIFDKDLTFLIVDEVIGMSIAKYISGDKGIFEYVRFDKLKPGILSKLGPFMDDVIAGLIGGVSANMYTRGKDDGGKAAKITEATKIIGATKPVPGKRKSRFAG
ncbi:alpha-ribazole phosphatase CobZ [Candidatus Methanoperedens nitroreducens]|uniref:Alpha-ribazole phosphatase CobZ n=1 Tax=Candidatus Methanoperedens nitratireducens TaxID=1392998 RepID=A0A062V7M9_9EURY|nr:alpha-ribazole phosphatase CobZ [Candidatus Methanoperedens nitroreducens]KCZ72563.1 alpha-ribazole phosphatase CobZ [Candidatus Methanoperedens nitroreducens]MDJ1423505.1 alpha-ribazole phosphatase CobZ [Candidatus Methanoperedens sp.]